MAGATCDARKKGCYDERMTYRRADDTGTARLRPAGREALHHANCTQHQNLMMNHDDDEDQQRPLPPSTAPYYDGDAYRFRMLPNCPRPFDVSDCSVGHDGGA